MLALLVWLIAAAAPAAQTADQIAALASSGNLRAARRALEAASARSQDPGLQFVSVCLDLEQSRLASASSMLERLRTRAPHNLEVTLLAHLVEERTRSPSDPWTAVAARAWKAAGRPTPGENPILRDVDSVAALPRTLSQQGDSSDRFLVQFAESTDAKASPLADAAIRGLQSPAWRDTSRLVATQVLLRQGASEREAAAALETVSRLSQAHPEDGYLAASAVLRGTDETQPLTLPELLALEDALGRSEFGLPIRSLFVEFRSAYVSVLPVASAAARAFSATIAALPLETHVLLSRRASATTQPTARARAAMLLLRAGSRLQHRPSFLERAIGLGLESKAMMLEGKEDAALRVGERRKELAAFMEQSHRFWRFVLPIASLRAEHSERAATNEVELAEEMTR
jgi:hypothetical protein